MENGWIDLPEDLMRLFYVGFKLAERELRRRPKQRWVTDLVRAQPRFLPFGLVLRDDGEVARVHDATWPSHASLDEMWALVQAAIKKEIRGGAKVGLIGVDASAGLDDDPPRDAILMFGQTVQGERLQVAIPYKLRWGRLSFDAPEMSPFTPRGADQLRR